MSKAVLIADEIFGFSEPEPVLAVNPHNFEPVRVARDAKAPLNKEKTFAKYFQSGPAGYSCLVNEALAGKLDKCPLRSLAWRVFLEVIPTDSLPEEWYGLFEHLRNEYVNLKAKHQLDPHHTPVQPTSSAESTDHPLLDNPESEWDKYYKAQELKTEIMQDILRTYQEMDYFQLPSTHEIMMNILFTYCCEHPDVSYRQGMHELLALVLYIMNKDIVKASDVDQNALWTVVCNEEYFEHDAFAIFNKIMLHTKPWFMGASSRHGEPPIVTKSKNIQNVLLKKIDPLLHSHLTELGIEPQIYALRWVRLMFGREFHVEDVLLLWDAIFAYGNQFILVEYICIAMLLYIRDELLEKDSNDCLFRLLKFPPVEDIRVFVGRSKDLIEGRHPLFASPVVERPPSLLSAFSASVRAKSESHELPIGEKLKKLEAENQSIKMQQQHLSSRLERIVHVLQQAAMKNSQSDDFESTILALAELKQVKDVMSGLLPYDSMMPQL